MARRRPHRLLPVFGALGLVAAGAAIALPPVLRAAAATHGPYAAPVVEDENPDPSIVETTIVADEATVNVGGVTARVKAFNGSIPGPEFHLTPGQRVIVHFENRLKTESTAIHWHGIELANASDGSPLTQNQVPPGGTFLYDFVAPRPGIYWYHPHHHSATNQVFQGLYGAIVVTDPNESALIGSGTLPGAADTLTLTLSDITVCKSPGHNDTVTYRPSLPWVGGEDLPEQSEPTPRDLCDTPVDDDGQPLAKPLASGTVPDVQLDGPRTNEGQRVLTNGVNVGGRGGSPSAPGALAATARTRTVRPGQGLRLRLVDAAATRYFRLLLTDATGTPIPLVRVGGEGGLLDDAVIEGTQPGGFDFGYEAGELLLTPGDRADVVVAIPATATGVATLWTQDFRRTGGGDGSDGWTNTPTVPVAHFKITGAAVSPAFTIGAGTPLRSATGDPQEVLPAPSGTLLAPATFTPPKPGLASSQIRFTADASAPSIDNVVGMHHYAMDYTVEPHTGSTRYARLGDVLELTVRNVTGAHHPFHLHGFSIQPLQLSSCQGAVTGYVFPEPEFVDNIDVPGKCTLTYRIRLEDRPMVDGVTPGGGLGRWMIHCHIFFHHTLGMMSELVVTDADGNERPAVDAAVPAVGPDEEGPVTMTGSYHDPDGDTVTLAASVGDLVDHGDGTWSWSLDPGLPGTPVYVTATDSHGNRGQTLFHVALPDELPPTGRGGGSGTAAIATLLVVVGLAIVTFSSRGRRARSAKIAG